MFFSSRQSHDPPALPALGTLATTFSLLLLCSSNPVTYAESLDHTSASPPLSPRDLVPRDMMGPMPPSYFFQRLPAQSFGPPSYPPMGYGGPMPGGFFNKRAMARRRRRDDLFGGILPIDLKKNHSQPSSGSNPTPGPETKQGSESAPESTPGSTTPPSGSSPSSSPPSNPAAPETVPAPPHAPESAPPSAQPAPAPQQQPATQSGPGSSSVAPPNAAQAPQSPPPAIAQQTPPTEDQTKANSGKPGTLPGLLGGILNTEGDSSIIGGHGQPHHDTTATPENET
ncbi:hypothetical protein BGW38_008542, partial [Lunasporangiospora selenospora]